MMIKIQDNVLVNTEKISVIQLREINKKLRVEIIVDNKSFVVDENKVSGELRNFMRGELDGQEKLMKQFTSV